MDLARTQAGLGQLDEAQTTFEGVLERTPDSLAALVAAGQVAKQQANWSCCRSVFAGRQPVAGTRDILYGLVSAQLYGNQTTRSRLLESYIPWSPKTYGLPTCLR